MTRLPLPGISIIMCAVPRPRSAENYRAPMNSGVEESQVTTTTDKELLHLMPRSKWVQRVTCWYSPPARDSVRKPGNES